MILSYGDSKGQCHSLENASMSICRLCVMNAVVLSNSDTPVGMSKLIEEDIH